MMYGSYFKKDIYLNLLKQLKQLECYEIQKKNLNFNLEQAELLSQISNSEDY